MQKQSKGHLILKAINFKITILWIFHYQISIS